MFGFVCGWISSWIIARISNDAIAEVSITLAAAYLTFYVSEAILEVSGVLAVVVSRCRIPGKCRGRYRCDSNSVTLSQVLGLVLNYERTAISPEVEPWMHEYVCM